MMMELKPIIFKLFNVSCVVINTSHREIRSTYTLLFMIGNLSLYKLLLAKYKFSAKYISETN